MTDESNEEKEATGGIIKQTVDSVTALTKAVPIYQDAVQPFAKEAGKALGTVGKAVNVALAPISLVVWGYDKISDFLENKVAEKLEKVPEERISTPPPNVAGPAIEALKFTGHDETLQDLFANLIANSLDSKTVLEAHPAFVDIIKNISSDEGLILKLFAGAQQFPIVDVRLNLKKNGGFNILHRNVSEIGKLANCKHPQLTTNYLDNLCRLGLLGIPSGRRINDPKAYESLTSDPGIEQLKKQFENNEDFSIGFEQKYIEVTGMGRQFINACVIDKRARG
jgi:hypothetical protein